MLRRISTICLAALVTQISTQADPRTDAIAVDMAAMMKMAEGAKDKAPDKSPFPKFEDVTKDMEAKKGLFTLWSYPAGTKDKDSSWRRMMPLVRPLWTSSCPCSGATSSGSSKRWKGCR